MVSGEEFTAIIERVDDAEFKDLLTAAWETGCRPQEVCRVEARHVDIANARWVFPISEAKGKRKARVVYLSDKALEITKRLLKEHPEGPIFRNRRGTTLDFWGDKLPISPAQGKTGIQVLSLQFSSHAHHAGLGGRIDHGSRARAHGAYRRKDD